MQEKAKLSHIRQKSANYGTLMLIKQNYVQLGKNQQIKVKLCKNIIYAKFGTINQKSAN